MSGQARHSIDVTSERDAGGDVVAARIRFGPHYVVEVRNEGSRVTFGLVATHHGFAADASDVDGELERIIDDVRRAHPHTEVD